MSRDLFDLGARLHAAATGEPVVVAAYAPALPPTAPVAVTVDHDGEHLHLQATDGTTRTTGTDRDALRALDNLGVRLDGTYRTLVVESAASVGALARLARAHPAAACSPVIGWWDQRADHPGSGAVHAVVPTARLRWVLGVVPERERDLTTWLTWHRITVTGPDALLELARRTASGSTLPGLLDAAGADTASWDRYVGRIGAGRSWLAPDTRADAALGLASRSHASELFASLRLDDPLVARVAAFDGTVVTGQVQHADRDSLVIRAARPLSRLRVDAEVTGWLGDPTDADRSPCVVGRVVDATVGKDAALTITVGEPTKRPTTLRPGQTVTLRPGRTDPFMQANGRRLMAMGFHRSANWIAGRGKPVARRGDVPLDVMVAAADTD